MKFLRCYTWLLVLVFFASISSIHAACTTTADGVCTPPANAAIARLMGPIVPETSYAIPFARVAVPQLYTDIVDNALANPPTLGAKLTGTFQYIDAPSRIVGTGSLLTTEAPAGTCLIIATADGGAGNGRLLVIANAPTDDTHVAFANFQSFATPGTGLSVYYCPAETSTFSRVWWVMVPGQQTQYSWDYYGGGVAIYKHYIATGDSAWLTKFHTWADLHWQWSLNWGTYPANNRDIDLIQHFIRALEDRDITKFNAIYHLFHDVLTLNNHQTDDANNWDRQYVQDTREKGYFSAGLAEGAIADQAVYGGDDTHHTWYCTTLADQMNGWIAKQEPEGFIDDPVFQWDNETPYQGKGNSPWRFNVVIRAWQLAYEVLNDTSSVGCNNPTVAANLLVAIQKGTDWVYDYGVSKVAQGGNGYPHFSVGQVTKGFIGYGVASGVGDLAATLSSTTVTGSGTSFLSTAGCNGTKWLAVTKVATYHYLPIYKILSCADDTHLTIDHPFGYYSEPSSFSIGDTCNGPGGVCYLIADSASTNSASSASYFDPIDTTPPNGDSGAIRDLPGVQGWVYHYTGITKYLTQAKETLARTWRGPSDGPYGTMAPSGGYGITTGAYGLGNYGGHTTDENGVSCAVASCVDGLTRALAGGGCGNGCGDGPFIAQGKNFFQATGFLNGINAFAYVLMAPVTVASVPPPRISSSSRSSSTTRQ